MQKKNMIMILDIIKSRKHLTKRKKFKNISTTQVVNASLPVKKLTILKHTRRKIRNQKEL
jgi:hypothetical protein